MIRSILVVAVCMFVLVAASPVRMGYEVGDTVADFKLKNTNGKMVSLADYKEAKGAIVIFDCNTCPYSKAYNDRILALGKKYSAKTFPLILVQSNDATKSPGDSYDEMVKYAAAHGYDFPYLHDESQAVAKNFGATNTPHAYVLKKDGATFKVAYIGAIDDNAKDASGVTKRYVEDAADAVIGNKAAATTKTKAIGCTIKWAE